MNNAGTKAEVLKRAILKQYKSVRQFAAKMGIPYSTLVTALDRGIEGMAYDTVIRMCDMLNLNPIDFSSIEEGKGLSSQIAVKRVMDTYNQLNKVGRKKVLDIIEDYTKISEYTSTEM